jgi:hypothetical protein
MPNRFHHVRGPLALLVFAVTLSAFAQPRPPPDVPDFAVPAQKRDALIKGIFDELRAKYIFPDRLDAAFAELKKRWGDAGFQKLDRAHALVDRMNADLRDIFNDGHLNLRLAAAMPPGIFGDPDHPDPKAVAEQEAFARRFHFGVVRAEVLRGNIGYLQVRGFSGYGPGVKQAYADAMGFVRDTDSLIIDVRDNGGGDGDSVAELVGYLLDKKTLLLEETFRTKAGPQPHYSAETVPGPRYGITRDVFVLTSGRTFSAAEEFSYDLQSLKRATIVGEKTGGGANHNVFVRVANDFALSIPYGTVRNPITGTNWEGVGVQPDVAAKPEEAQKVAERLALERQIARERDPALKERLQRLLAELQK